MLLNRSRAFDFMRRYGLDAIVATSPVNVTYFSDYYCWLDPLTKKYMMNPGGTTELALPSYALLPLEGEAALIVNPMFALNAVDSWITDLHPFGASGLDEIAPGASFPQRFHRVLNAATSNSNQATPVDALLSVLKARRLAEAQIGIETEGLTEATCEAIKSGLPRAGFKDCSNLIRLIRMVKSAEEQKRLTRAAEIAELAAFESLELAEPGRPMSEIVHHFRVRAAQLGAGFDHFAFASHGLGIAMEPDYVLEAGDVTYIDYGCIVGHYYSDSGLTLALGEPSKQMSDRYAALQTCIDAGAESLRPGRRGSDVQKSMASVLSNARVTGSFPHRRRAGPRSPRLSGLSPR